MTPELVLDAGAELGEGPTWDSEKGVLYWVDILRGQVHTYDPDKSDDVAVETRRYPSCIVPKKSGGVLVTLQHGFYTLDLRDGRVSPLAEVENDLPGNRFNDGKCDPAGRLWAGTMDMKEEAASGALYRLEGEDVRRVLSGISISNGLGWSPDSATMFHIDTPTRKVSAFEYDVETGDLKGRRTVVDFSLDQPGKPDGMAVDAEGMIWVAHWGGHLVTRWNPETGRAVGRVELTESNVTSCCFGGRHLDELYVTTARAGLGRGDLERQPHAGGLFKVRTGVRGLPAHAFEG